MEMNCPQCKKQMEKRSFFSINTFFGGLHLFEVLVAFLIVPVMMAGIIGWSIISVLIILAIALCWGKRWYRCKECDYTTVQKLNPTHP